MAKTRDRAEQIRDKLFHGFASYGIFKNDYVYRSIVLSAVGAAVTVAFTVYYGYFGIVNKSLWYGAYAGYMLILALQRALLIVLYNYARRKSGGDKDKSDRIKMQIYLANGAVFVPVTIVLSVITALLINSQKPIVSDAIIAISTAAYAFYKIFAAIRNFVKSKAVNDKILQTIRNINLIDALISIILLEGTLITTFGEFTRDMLAIIGVSGLAVCSFAIALGSYMIISAAKQLRLNP